MRVFCISENPEILLKMNTYEIQKRHIALVNAKIDREIKLDLNSRLIALEKRLTNQEKILDEKIGGLKEKLVQQMKELSDGFDLIMEEKQRITKSLGLELSKIDRELRTDILSTIEVGKVGFKELVQNVDKEIVIKKCDVRKIVQEILNQREQLSEKESTVEDEESTEPESSDGEGDGEVPVGMVLGSPSYSPRSPETEGSDCEPVLKKLKRE